ncbi:MAG: PEP-CTERM system TPR-repeat protein PrsT, partial [Alphaproteobacteria bacterium]|nr:PEP-CTERM system TPR-repeat protein PrsT [Alphaproteobacteria bacterium]
EIDAALADLLVRERKYGRILDELPEGARRKDLEARVRTARGYAELNLRQNHDAELAFRQGIALAQTGLAQARMTSGDLNGAGELLEQAVTADPKLVDPWILLSRVRLLQNKPDAARTAIDKAIALAPSNLVALLDRASLLVETDDKQAAADVAIILDATPDNWRALLVDAVIKARHQQWQDSLASLMAIGAPESLPKALYLLGRVNLALGQISAADNYITHYLAIAPDDPAGIAVKAEVLGQLGKPSGSIDLLKKALTRNPDNPQLLALLSDAYSRNGQPKEAAATLDRLSQVSPRDAATRIQLAQQRFAVGAIDDALGDLAIARATEKLTPQATSLEIDALLKAGRLDDATAAVAELRRAMPDSPVPETYLGVIALRRGGVADARPHFEKALALQPDFATAAVDLAQTYRAERRFDEARGVYDRILQQQPNSVPLLMARADLELADKKPDAAINLLERARTADPTATEPRFELVSMYLDRQEGAKAVAISHELERLAPRDQRTISALAESELANNERQAAIADFNRVIDMSANAPEPLLRLADVLATGGDVQSGYGLMRKALNANPGDPHVQQALLDFSVKTGNTGASADFVRDLRVRHPDDIGLAALLGALYEADHKYDRAVRIYAEGLAKAKSGDLIRGLARSQAHTDSLDVATATLQKWLADQPDDYPSRVLLASMLADAKEPDKAMAEYERLLAANPRDVGVLNNLAALYAAKSDARAAGLAEQAYALAPQSPAVADTLGWILVQSGDTERGLKLLQDAATAAPQSAIRYHLAVALSKAGRRDDAVHVLGELLKSDTP